MVHSWCTRGALVVDSWYTHGAIVVQSWCARGDIVVPSWCTRGAVKSFRSKKTRFLVSFGFELMPAGASPKILATLDFNILKC